MNAVKDMFDREEQKQYLVPIVITDDGSPQQTGTSTLVVIIGGKGYYCGFLKLCTIRIAEMCFR